jgi:hypothetical protein
MKNRGWLLAFGQVISDIDNVWWDLIAKNFNVEIVGSICIYSQNTYLYLEARYQKMGTRMATSGKITLDTTCTSVAILAFSAI